jgi:hypothetical protein
MQFDYAGRVIATFGLTLWPPFICVAEEEPPVERNFYKDRNKVNQWAIICQRKYFSQA